MFSVLVLGVMMLLIPATSIANAQEYNDRHYEDKKFKKIDKKSYNEPYKKEDERKSYYSKDKEQSDEPVIIIKNEPIQKKEKKKVMKELPMLFVKKDVLYCDFFSGSGQTCLNESTIPEPNSNRYVQTCTATSGDAGEVCDTVNEESFDIVVSDDVKFPGSVEGTKINFNGERFTITEEINFEPENEPGLQEEFNSLCMAAGFDSGSIFDIGDAVLLICILIEGDCSGFVQESELKECTVKNYAIVTLF